MAQLKAKRAEYRAKQTEIIEKRLEARANRRNLNVLTEKQMRQKEMQTKKAQEAYKRLKYKKGNQDIAFKNVLDEGNKWQTNFVSSNVWKFKTRGNNLLEGFLNGNVYLYFGVAK
ncbi:hypothetical protein, partial [Conexibacter sp. CPCC 205762]|uniref:hypothetical protein n=1 Tax=Conexibacter sp. CPCC 205762 TaxID=3064573 RepID=UPI00272650B7